MIRGSGFRVGQCWVPQVGLQPDSAHLKGGLGSEAWDGGGDGSPWKGAGAGFPCMTDAPSVQSHKPEQCHVLKAQHLPPQTQTLALTESQLPNQERIPVGEALEELLADTAPWPRGPSSDRYHEGPKRLLGSCVP